MPTPAAQLKEGNNDPHNQGYNNQGKEYHEKISAISTRNKIYKKNDGRGTEDNKQ